MISLYDIICVDVVLLTSHEYLVISSRATLLTQIVLSIKLPDATGEYWELDPGHGGHVE